MSREQEVKILNIDVVAIEKKLLDLGAHLISREEQKNYTIDSEDHPLSNYLEGYLRIRQSKDLITGKEKEEITLKEQVKNNKVRENIEHNVEIHDGDKLLSILNKIGYTKIHCGSKHRISYKLENARFDIDTWDKDTYPEPYMEIEMENSADLNRLLELLNIDPEQVSKLSIAELRENIKKQEV